MKIKNLLLLGTALTATLAPAALAATAQPASARACIQFNDLESTQGFVVGSRFLYCNPPGVENPRPVTVQRASGGSWVTVAYDDGFTGSAVYKCVGTSTRTYRLKEVPSKQITVPCS